jgi:hypothetical protein
MLYVIDYRNGSMGHTILAHTLFACNKVDVDIDQIFSTTGNAHAINDLNQTNLICSHNLEHALTKPSIQLLSVVCTGWDEVLRKHMSYCKYYGMFPTENNLEKFNFKFVPDIDPLEYVSISYYDSYDTLHTHDSSVLHLGQYLERQLTCLQWQVENILGWCWDQSRSDRFHNRMLVHNLKYLQWQQSMQLIVHQTLKNTVVHCNLEFWEKAIVISMACKQKKVHPSSLHWNEYKFLSNNNQTLIRSLNG